MRLLSANLYIKIVLWMLLNLVLLAVLSACIACWALMGRGYDGVLPASLFSARADSALRVVGANLQYRSALQWEELLKSHTGKLPVRLHVQTLDTESITEFLSQKLEGYKVPQLIEEVAEIARTQNGKLNRKEMIRQYSNI